MMNTLSLRKPLLIFGAAVLLSMLGLIISTYTPAGAQGETSMNRTISVSGTGQVFGTPDVAYINLGVDQTDSDLARAVENARTTLANIITALEAAGVAREDIQTANFNVYPEDRFNPTTGMPTGERTFRAQLAVNVTVRQIENASAIITAALGAGANSLNGLSFGIADTTALESEARTKAVENARLRANELAGALGVSVGDVMTIVEGVNMPVPLMEARNVLMSDVAGGNAQIAPGQLGVTVNISVVFAIGG
jgi:uncharacterized protein